MSTEIEEKTERLVRLCADEGLGGILINSQPNFSWLSAGATNGVDTSRENGVATLFVRRDGKRFVIASRIEIQRIANEELRGAAFDPVEFAWEAEKASPTIVSELAQSINSSALPIGADTSFGPNVKLIEGAISLARYRLTDPEIERYRALGKEAGAVIGDLARSVEPGITEREVARKVDDALTAIGAKSIVTLVAADDRLQKYRHPVPKDTPWRNILMIVVCVRRNGLVASLTRIVCVGKRSHELDRRTKASANVNAELFAATRPGIIGSELYEIAARTYSEEGFPGEEKLHHQGGAAGYRTRDWVAHPKSTDKVQERQAFAWNPSVTGSKVEETCIAYADRVEIITATPDWPTIQMEVAGKEYQFPDVLEL